MDYCTWFPEGWWSTCCEAHDTGYTEQLGQAVADATLFFCVATSGDGLLQQAVGIVVGAVMLIGVTLFGRRYYDNAKGKAKV